MTETTSEEGEYYYYYYEYDDEKGTSAEAKVSSMSSNSPPAANPSETEGETYYYYYYDDGDSGESNESMKNEDDLQVSNGEEAAEVLISGKTDNTEQNEDTVKTQPTQTSGDGDYYYYYYENDSKLPSESPSEEQYYYYYYDQEDDSIEQPQTSTNSTSSLPTEEEDEYYYYYYDDDDKKDSANKDSSEPIPHEIATGRGCHNYLLSLASEKVHKNDLSFTFTLETNKNFRDWNGIASKIIDMASTSVLSCNKKDHKRSKAHGIFLIHFPAKEPLIEVNQCEPIANKLNNCVVFTGNILLASHKVITTEESRDTYISLEAAIDSLNNVDDNVVFAKYLGPIHELHRSQDKLGEQVGIIVLLLLSIPLVFFIYKVQRKFLRGYRRVTFLNE